MSHVGECLHVPCTCGNYDYGLEGLHAEIKEHLRRGKRRSLRMFAAALSIWVPIDLYQGKVLGAVITAALVVLAVGLSFVLWRKP